MKQFHDTDIFQSDLTGKWIVAFGDGSSIEYDTEEDACFLQRVHRKQWGRDEMSGEATSDSVLQRLAVYVTADDVDLPPEELARLVADRIREDLLSC